MADDKVQKGFNVLELTGALLPQGALVTGVKTGWRFAWTTLMRELAPQSKDGSYVRPRYDFQGVIGKGRFQDEAGRYHLYAGLACPWCHRVELVRSVRGLEDYMSMTRVLDRPEEASRGGWIFTRQNPDPVIGAKDLREVYDALSEGDKGFRGRCTAPLLVDKKGKKIVNNESADLMRMLNSVKPALKENDHRWRVDLCPEELRTKIDEVNEWVYKDVNNGVYQCGFATTQAGYDAAEGRLTAALARLDALLSTQRFLVGDRITEADLRLFPTAVRFDAVYNSFFRCSRQRISDLPNLNAWLRDMMRARGVRETVDIPGYRESYFGQLFPLNPSGIIPAAPVVDLDSDPARGPTDPASMFHLRQ